MESHLQEATTQLPPETYTGHRKEAWKDRDERYLVFSWFNQGEKMKRLLRAELESNCHQTILNSVSNELLWVVIISHNSPKESKLNKSSNFPSSNSLP